MGSHGRFRLYLSPKKIPTKSSNENFPKMESIICKLICVTFAVVSVSAVNRDKDLMTILAKERQEMRDERKEMREMFQRETARLDKETARLDEEDKRQQKENLKLKEQNDKLQQQDQKLKEEIVKLRQDNQNDKEQIVKLRRENKKLRRADVEIKQTIRQRDQNNSLEVTKMKKFIRQDDVHSELKKIIRNEINDFLIVEKMCVSGRSSVISAGRVSNYKVEFGHTFPRKPTVSASLYHVYNYGGGQGGASAYVQSVSNSSAVIGLDTQYGNSRMNAAFAWLACL